MISVSTRLIVSKVDYCLLDLVCTFVCACDQSQKKKCKQEIGNLRIYWKKILFYSSEVCEKFTHEHDYFLGYSLFMLKCTAALTQP